MYPHEYVNAFTLTLHTMFSCNILSKLSCLLTCFKDRHRDKGNIDIYLVAMHNKFLISQTFTIMGSKNTHKVLFTLKVPSFCWGCHG